MWESKDWILAAAVSVITLLITKGWPIAQWLIEFFRRTQREDSTEDERRENRIADLRTEGYEQVIARLDKNDEIKNEKINRLEKEHADCLQKAARLDERVMNLEKENSQQSEQIELLLAWKRSRGGSDTIEKIVQPTQPKEKK